jgi:hypothetical protein
MPDSLLNLVAELFAGGLRLHSARASFSCINQRSSVFCPAHGNGISEVSCHARSSDFALPGLCCNGGVAIREMSRKLSVLRVAAF